MRFLADENLQSKIVAWLRSQGHDVLYAAESLEEATDAKLLSIAREEERVLITDDKDFGELVFHRRLASAGVVLVRLETPRVSERIERLRQVWSQVESQAKRRFLVITEERVRVRSALPDA